MGQLLTTHPGGSGGDEDGSGGRSPSRQGAGTGPSEPPKLVGDGGGALLHIWEILRGLGFFVGDDFISVGGSRGCAQKAQAALARRPP